MAKDITPLSNGIVGDVSETRLTLSQIESDPKYSLEVDPFDEYDFNDYEKEFIRQFIQWKNVPKAAELAMLDNEDAKRFFLTKECQSELKRINAAIYARQFARPMLSIDDIGGYLSSLLTDETVYADRLSVKDKLAIIKMILDLNNLKLNGQMQTNASQNINIELKNLSVKTIKQLLTTADVQKLEAKLSEDELAMISELSTDEILAILNDINGGNKQ